MSPRSRLRSASALFVLGALALASSGCGGPGPSDTDAGEDAARIDAGRCASDVDCDDGLFCNGVERCAGGTCTSGARPTCDDGIACTVDGCSEEMRACRSRVPDLDGDGHGDLACVDGTGAPLGDDCDEADADRFAGNVPERCDATGHDEDCDPTTHGGRDHDGDGFEDQACCNGSACGDDCDDAHASAHPGATEACNGIDDDCDGHVDENVAVAGFVDSDRDGYGDAARPTTACAAAPGFSVQGDDCDDDRLDRNPGQTELCDLIDNDCDTRIDENAAAVDWYPDADGDGFGSAHGDGTHACVPPAGYSLRGSDCDDRTVAISPAAAETCNGIDDDCNGVADFRIAAGDTEDDDLDGVADAACGAPRGRDCDDRDGASLPGEAETCDGRDNDCDARVDEGAIATVFYADADGDGWGRDATLDVGCSQHTGFAPRGGDCDDAASDRHPGVSEACNGSDDDCDGATDEGGAAAACGLPHAIAGCVAGTCAALGCVSGFGDCSAAAGCETDLATSTAHCGRCGHACPGGDPCIAGACSAAPFDTTGLVTWLDANDPRITVADGAPLTGWPNRAGGPDYVVFGATPTLRAASSFGSGRSVLFAGGGVHSVSDVLDTSQHSIFVVSWPTTVTNDDMVGTDLFVGPVGEILLMFYANHERGHHWESGGLLAIDSAGTVAANAPHLAVQIGDAATLRTYLDGALAASAANPTVPPDSSLQPVFVGNRCDGCYLAGAFQGEIAEVLVFGRAVTATEQAQIEAYLRGRWGF